MKENKNIIKKRMEKAFEPGFSCLWNGVGEAVVLPEESEQLGAGPVDGHEGGVEALVGEHELEDPLAAARPLAGLVDVEVEDAVRGHLVLLPAAVQEEQVLLPNLEHKRHFM